MVKWSKTSPFHGGNPSSNLGRVTKEKTFERMSFSFSYRSCAFSMRPCYARRTRDTRLTRRYASKLARSAPTYLSMYLLTQFRDCTAFSQTVGKCFWMNKA